MTLGMSIQCVTCHYWKVIIFASVCRRERSSTVIVCGMIKCTVGTERDTWWTWNKWSLFPPFFFITNSIVILQSKYALWMKIETEFERENSERIAYLLSCCSQTAGVESLVFYFCTFSCILSIKRCYHIPKDSFLKLKIVYAYFFV